MYVEVVVVVVVVVVMCCGVVASAGIANTVTLYRGHGGNRGYGYFILSTLNRYQTQGLPVHRHLNRR